MPLVAFLSIIDLMKKLLRRIIISIGSIYVVTFINGGFYYDNGFQTLFLAGFVMFFLDTIVEPVLNIIFLPINFLTAGLFKWVIGVGLLYALTYFVPAVHITPWTFSGYTLVIPNTPQIPQISIPPYSFNFWTNLVLVSFMFNFVSGIFHWILEE